RHSLRIRCYGLVTCSSGPPPGRTKTAPRCDTSNSPTTNGTPSPKPAKMKVLHNFGREDHIDRAAVERLVGSLCRLLDPSRAAALTSGADLTFIGSAAFGGPYLLDQLWRQLKIDTILTKALASTRRSPFTERVLFT